MSTLVSLSNILKPVAIIIFIKPICDALYNILKVVEVYLEKNQDN